MILIYDRSDLTSQSENKTIRQVELMDFRFSIQPTQLASAVLFIDKEKGLLRVLKWRWNAEFDINGVFNSVEFAEIIQDALEMDKKLGKSLLKPGTNKFRD